MRIAIIGTKGMPARSGGIERHVEELSTRLVGQGFGVTVFTRPWYTGPVPAAYKGVRLVPIPSVRTKHLDAISHSFRATMRAMRENFDVYHFQGVGPSLLSFLPRIFRPKAKVVCTFHCLDRRQTKWGFFARLILRFGEFAACRFAHKTIVVSKTLAHYAREVWGCRAEYIPNGITPPKARLPLRRALSKHRLTRGRYAVMVSRLTPQKGAHVLIEAWNRMKRSTENLDIHSMKLVVVGDADWNDEYAAALREEAKAFRDVVFTGLQTGDDLHALIAGAAFAVHPSETEGLPIAVLEKMSHGKAVLVSDIPEHLEIVEGRGFTFRTGDVRDLMLQLYFLATHPKECAEKGALAKTYVEAFYHWDEVAKATGDVYRALAPGHARGAAAVGTASRRVAS